MGINIHLVLLLLIAAELSARDLPRIHLNKVSCLSVHLDNNKTSEERFCQGFLLQ